MKLAVGVSEDRATDLDIIGFVLFCVFFFFFKQKTAYEIVDCDWSSDVCSSDLWMVTHVDVHWTEKVQSMLNCLKAIAPKT